MPKLDLGGILQVAQRLLHLAGMTNFLVHGSGQAWSCAIRNSSELSEVLM